MIKTNMVIKSVKYYLIEIFNRPSVIIGPIFAPFIFLLISIFIKNISIESYAIKLVVFSQMLPMSIILLITTFALSINSLLIVEKRETGFLNFITKTKMNNTSYFLGIFLGSFILLNLAIILMIVLYAIIFNISITKSVNIYLFSNLIYMSMYMFSLIVAKIFRDSKKLLNYMTIIYLLLMFTVSFPTLFSLINGKPATEYYIYLCWNPLIYLNDFILYSLGITKNLWIKFPELAIVLFIFIIFELFIYKIFGKIKLFKR